MVDHLTGVLGIAMKARKWDDGSRNGMHDFYVEGGAQKIALEVTTLANGARVGRDFRWAHEVPDGHLKVEGLRGCWVAHHEGDAEALDVIPTVRAHLPRLEALGLTQVDTRAWQRHAFSPDDRRPVGYEQWRALNLVGILQVSCIVDASQALLDEHGGEVHLVRGFGVARPAERNFPVTVIREQLREPDLHRSDVTKLLAVHDATARHLWMWIEPTEGFAMIRSFESEGSPDVSLDGEGLDGVWLGRSPGPSLVAGHAWLRGLGWSAFSTTRNEADVA